VGSPRWAFWIDRGGTFTDCLGLDPTTGEVHVAKVLSSDRAPLEGIRRILGLEAAAPIPPCDIRMGTTLATNALLERKGASTLLVITRGFRDLLEIGTQARPEIFAVDIRKPEVLYTAVLEVDARMDFEGNVVERPDPERVRAELRGFRERGLRSVAIVLLHAYRAGELEREIGRIAEETGFEHVALSHEVAPEIGIVGRGDTTTVDAYLTPLIRDYVRTLLAELPGSSLRIMQSSGGLTSALRFRGPDAILSGPAAGVVAYAHVAERAGEKKAIGFDMGGTSTDVSRFDGEFERVYETQTAGVRIRAPMMAIHTVAAGGGSLCRYDGHRFTVGPESAGAVPGPLCYGHPEARALTLTDVNLALGRVAPDRFPFPLRKDRVLRALDDLVAELRVRGIDRTPEAVAEGFFEIANANMTEAIRRVSVARGYDVREYTLVAFGGAAGQHACAIARRLGIRRILCHPYAGVLSAYGMGLADVSWHGDRDLGALLLDGELDEAAGLAFRELESQGREILREEGFSSERVRVVQRLDLRYRGTETALTVPEGSAADRRSAFEALHRQRFGYARPGHPVEAVVARVEVVGQHIPPPEAPVDPKGRSGEARSATRAFGRDAVPVFTREDLRPGQRLEGPALVLEATGTLVVEPGFVLTVDAQDRIVLEDRAGRPAREQVGAELDPVSLEIFNNLFMSMAEQMGIILQRTALSTNIRERLDFSCALFDPEGGLVANAPHIPVHLGAMGETVRAVFEAFPEPRPGDVFVSNDPSAGGSHLPDVTVVTPVFDRSGALRFFTASRGHHADIGGITPGSMPPFSQRLEEEGVVLRPTRIVRDGRLDEAGVEEVLQRGPHPARNPRENLADLEAQIAANHTGERLLHQMVERYGLETVLAYMQHVQDNAAAKVSEEIAKISDGEHRFTDRLDDGTPIGVVLRVRGSQMEVDFTGTGAQVEGNLNAPRAVTVAALIYVLRTLVGESIPLNGGCLRPVSIRIPAGSVLSPSPERAVAGGNVETSQRIVDVLLGAIGGVAASQGTMNNFTFGTDRFGYYETIGGGAGAGEGFHGASGVHTHMTNTRITDPEILEVRFPVWLREFGIRVDSGGAGRWRGGDGLVRELEFRVPMRVSILSERRMRAPFGLAGGDPGAAGRNLHNGRDVGGKASFEVAPGDRVRIETPGGGGYGSPR
jgi:5-oxoprolinase (ATP-hydrolysing)